MKTFRILGMALVVVMLGFAMSACSDDDDDYLKELEKEYSRLIVGKWFRFTPELSIFLNYQADKTFSEVVWDKNNGGMRNRELIMLKEIYLLLILTTKFNVLSRYLRINLEF